MAEKEQQNNILEIKKSEQYATVEELFEKSQSGSVYYTLLFLSSLIVACGLLLNSSVVVIGGMLVTPLLSPILVIALGIAAGELKAIKSSSILVLKSVLMVAAVAFILALFFGVQTELKIFGDSLYAAALYFIVALVAGVAATFAWTRKQVADILPGTAIAVTLMPPLASAGIAISTLDFYTARVAALTFLFNLGGVILGALIVFSLLGFYRAKKVVEKEIKIQEKEAEKREEKKE